jgi:hypothetical protein
MLPALALVFASYLYPSICRLQRLISSVSSRGLCPVSRHRVPQPSADIRRLRTISDADLIIVLQEGQVAEQGTHEELLQIEGGVYQRLWQAQLSEGVA